jgi:uncharacterized phage protein (TIGR01671 family)
MREHKYRAWDTNLKEPMMYSDWKALWGDEVEGLIIMQFTGLKDKNGKEIYEGDILEENMFVKWCDEQGSYELFLYAFNDDGSDYCLACGGDMHWYEVAERPCPYEVIGNIYENPDLLK